jgi:hypothetical protein
MGLLVLDQIIICPKYHTPWQGNLRTFDQMPLRIPASKVKAAELKRIGRSLHHKF